MRTVQESTREREKCGLPLTLNGLLLERPAWELGLLLLVLGVDADEPVLTGKLLVVLLGTGGRGRRLLVGEM